MKVVCISDTHGHHEKVAVPDGDLLVHAGDVTRHGTVDDVGRFATWIAALPHPRKIVVAGNHDWALQREPQAARRALSGVPGLTYLEDSGCEVDGLKVWGSPWTPRFLTWAFQLPRGSALHRRWQLIPDDTDLLVVHGPPKGILDRVGGVLPKLAAAATTQSLHVGCASLTAAAKRIAPRLVVFGHIHEGYGIEARDGTTYVNASICNARYRPVNEAVVVHL